MGMGMMMRKGIMMRMMTSIEQYHHSVSSFRIIFPYHLSVSFPITILYHFFAKKAPKSAKRVNKPPFINRRTDQKTQKTVCVLVL